MYFNFKSHYLRLPYENLVKMEMLEMLFVMKTCANV